MVIAKTKDKFLGLRVYTGGTFDLFHVGHLNLLKRCHEIAGLTGQVIVSLNTDEFIEKYKGKKPLIPYEDRKAILESCKYVHSVMENYGGVDSKESIEIAGLIDVVAIGSDWARKDYYKQMQFDQDWLDERNISLIYIPYTRRISSTQIKKSL
jgi:glycerol-3-phosphate cytidylyltransferase